MLHRAAVLASIALVPALAHADTETTSAQTLVVVTPQAPVVVTSAPAAPAQAVQAPGAAEMPPIPAPPAAPQNEDWSNVSHINGQLVPVGQRNDYLYRFRKTNIATNPIGMMFGYYGISVSTALTQNVALRFDASAWSTDHGSRSGYEVGVTAPIYFRRTYSGPYFEPGLLIHGDSTSYDTSYDCVDCSTSSGNHWVGPQMLFGWAWMFDSGLNVSAAFGAAKRMSTSSMDSYSSDEPAPVGYFRLGYAF